MDDNIETRKARFNVIIQLGPRCTSETMNGDENSHSLTYPHVLYTRQIVTHQLSAGMQLVHCENKPPFVLCCEFCSSRFKPSRL